jgi:hypothetical protein
MQSGVISGKVRRIEEFGWKSAFFARMWGELGDFEMRNFRILRVATTDELSAAEPQPKLNRNTTDFADFTDGN